MAYHLLRFLLRIVSRMPFSVLYALSGMLYLIAYHVVGYRRKVVHKNLTECFPEKSDTEITAIEKRFYRHLADNIVETCKMGAMSKEEMGRRMHFTNIEDINARVRQGKSISLFLGHHGNWEWVSSMPLHLEKNAAHAQIYHKLSNKDFDRIMLENRAHFGCTNVEMRQTARFVNKLATENKLSIIGYIADQAPRAKDSHYFIPFLNHMTPVLTGTEKITKHYGHDAWFVKVTKVKRGYYEAEFVHMHPDPDSLPDFELTDIYYHMLEQEIRTQPELYLWTHKRFRNAKVFPENASTNNQQPTTNNAWT